MGSILKRMATGVSVFAVAGGVSSGAIALATAMFPSGNVCHLSAGDPETASGSVGAWTGRYSGSLSSCQNSTTVRGQLKRDIPWAGDPIDDAHAATGVTLSIRVSESCRNYGRGTYYTHVESTAGTSGDGSHKTNC